MGRSGLIDVGGPVDEGRDREVHTGDGVAAQKKRFGASRASGEGPAGRRIAVACREALQRGAARLFSLA